MGGWVMTQRDEGHNYRDSKNKAQAYERKQAEKEKLLKEFDKWLLTCPVDYEQVKHPSSDIVCINFLPDIKR